MFWILIATMVLVIAGVTLAVLSSGDGTGGPVTGGLVDAVPDRLDDPLPRDRPVAPADVVRVRFPVGARGYRMAEVDDVLDRLAAELAERDARITELETALAGAQALALDHQDLADEAPARADEATGGGAYPREAFADRAAENAAFVDGAFADGGPAQERSAGPGV
ncbi:DivIVA domain-containing protein [Streptomyces avicenniae]|uniref:DivIVA domain-containing protein n=1 Tax=Streptomyces avicenniae TaxID=500153 RepID=UPI000AB98175|nr:DivIVA domain-containing protein [Streptomyces avicenniae]